MSQGISRLGTAQKELGSWKLSIKIPRYLKISRYLKARNGSKRAGKARNGSKGAGEVEIEYLKFISRYLKVSQGSERPKRS